MKRKIVWIAALLLAAFAVLAAALCCSKERESVAADEVAFSGERDILRASLTYDEGLRTLRGRQSITVVNRTGVDLSEIVLRVYMNGPDEDAVTVSAIAVDGQSVSGVWEDPTVLRIAYPWKAGYAVTLSFTVMLKHARTDGVPVVTLPSLAMLEDGVWRADAYDELAEPSYAQPFDFVIELDGVLTAQMRRARDASFALLLDGKRRQSEIGGVRVTALAEDTKTAAMLLDRTREAMASLEAIGLPYPFETLTVARSDTGREDGAALSGLIALDADADKEQLLRRITRLIARETFGILVESDPWNAPWLSLSLASCAEMLAYRSRKGEDAYLTRLYEELEVASYVTRPYGVTVGASTAHFGSESEMTQVLRDQGAAMLLGIEQAAGEEAFMDALALYVQRSASKTATQEHLEAALMEATGSAWDGYLDDGLSF